MRFAFIVNNYPPKSGGVEHHVHALATRLVGSGHEVDVFTLDEHVGRREEEGISVVRIGEHLRVGGVLGFPPLGTARRLRRALRERPADVISVHTRFFPMTVLGMRVGRGLRIPVLHTEHGSDHVASPSPLIRGASRAVDLTLGRWVLRRATRVLGVSEEVTGFVRRLSGVEATVFYNAIELSEGAPAPQQRPQHLVFVGRVTDGKGWGPAIRAVEALRAEGRPVTGEFLGDGPELSALRAAVAASAAADALTVRGRVSGEEVRAALAGATLINPTVLAEGFQTTLLEALAEGGRVVTYPVPGARLLRERGAPVTVTEERSEAALLSTLRSVLDEGWVPAERAELERWAWPGRAAQFVEIAEEARS